MSLKEKIDSMKIEEIIENINFLYKKSQEEELTEEEKELQALCRKRYLDNVKRNFKAQLLVNMMIQIIKDKTF